jgi:hypothetical protein
MQITIDVPEMKCAKCDTVAAVQPHMIFSKSHQPPAAFREAFTPLMKAHTDATATDDLGNVWGVLADDKPAGWLKGPQDSDLCTECGAAWLEAGKAFLAPAPVAVPVVELTDEDGFPLPAAALPPMPSMTYGSSPPPQTRRQY